MREDFLNRARINVRSFLGEDALSRYDVSLGDSYLAPPPGRFDRVVLDLPEPWQVVPHAESVMVGGGILVAYTPSITQAVQVREALSKFWVDQRTLEVLHRTWHIDGMAVRPDHRMVAHTAFLTTARFVGAKELLNLRFNKNAFAGAFLGRFDHGIKLAVGKIGYTLSTLGLTLGSGVHG